MGQGCLPWSHAHLAEIPGGTQLTLLHRTYKVKGCGMWVSTGNLRQAQSPLPSLLTFAKD